MQTSVRPIGQNVLISQMTPETMTSGGLHIPDSAQKKMNFGVAIAVGPGRVLPNGTRVPLEVRQGDKVYWDKYQGTEFEHDGQKLWLVREDVITGRIPEGE
jgi:chaperonin GroES